MAICRVKGTIQMAIDRYEGNDNNSFSDSFLPSLLTHTDCLSSSSSPTHFPSFLHHLLFQSFFFLLPIQFFSPPCHHSFFLSFLLLLLHLLMFPSPSSFLLSPPLLSFLYFDSYFPHDKIFLNFFYRSSN